MSKNWLMNEHKVKVYFKGEVLLEKIVKSKSSRTAVTNVLTNIYKGEVDNVEVEQLTFNTKPEEEAIALPFIEPEAI